MSYALERVPVVDQSTAVGGLEAGVPPLRRLIRPLPDLKVVLLVGRKVDDGWRRYKARYPGTTASFRVMPTMHPSSPGIAGGNQMSRSEDIARLSADLREARRASDRSIKGRLHGSEMVAFLHRGGKFRPWRT
jgi:hypothetical protein